MAGRRRAGPAAVAAKTAPVAEAAAAVRRVTTAVTSFTASGPASALARQRLLAWWLGAAVVMAVSSGWAMWQEAATFGPRVSFWGGVDFANNTWRAVRGLLAGQNVYATGAHIPGMGYVGPVAWHSPAALTWQAPFAALPLRPALLAFTVASIAAIWGAVFILTRPRSPHAVLLAACCGAFAILAGGGSWTLLLGQPTGFELLGVAIVMRARRPWLAALGLMLAAATFQTGVPLALALIVLRAWPVVWRGTIMTAAFSLPPVVLGIFAAGGPVPFARTVVSGAGPFAVETSHRIDLGALLHRAGVHSLPAQVAAGIVVLALALAFLARLPPATRRLDHPPVLTLVITATLLCTYHESYDMLFVGGAVVPIVLAVRSISMLPIFGLAGISAGLSGNGPVAAFLDPLCLVAIAALSAQAACRAQVPRAPETPDPADSDVIGASGAALAGSDAPAGRRASHRHPPMT